MARTVTVKQEVGATGITVTVEVETGDAADAARVTVDGPQSVGHLRATKSQIDALQALVNVLVTEALQALTPG